MEPSEYCRVACEKVCASLVLLLCVLDSVPCLAANGQATNVVKWSGTKDEMNEVA